jgi:hypothetical protein
MINAIGNFIGVTIPTSGESDPYTTADGKQLFAIIGDSLGGTSDTGPGPTPTSGTVFEWDGSAEAEVTNADLAAANNGSPWPQMGITYNASSAKKSVFIDNHVPGSEFSPNGDNNNWSSTGTLRAAAETKIDSAVTNYDVIPKAIFVTLGSNDLRGSVAIATILSDIDAFFTWITTKYPDTDVLIMQVGKTDQAGGSPNTEGTARAHQIRARIKQNVINNTRVHFYGNGGTLPTYDALHWTQVGNNTAGNMAARWLLNPSYSKWARSIIASQSVDISTARKDLIEDFVTTVDFTTGVDTLYIGAAIPNSVGDLKPL